MNGPYLLSPAAEQDVEEIGAYIERDDPVAAHKLFAEIYDWFSRLGGRPAMGHRRPNLTHMPVRFWAVRGRHLIVYRDSPVPIEIVRVLSTYRDVAAILGKSLD